MKIIFSDLDGTLLDPNTYSWEDARPALRALRRKEAALVFCTSKTRAEVEYWREQMHVDAPFIVENGGAIYVPIGYFRSPIPHGSKRGSYRVIEFGSPYQDLVAGLEGASRDSGCRVLGFHDMSVAEICIRTRLPVRQAELAKQREYDEPFIILDEGMHRLAPAIESRGMRWTRGGRFCHITGNNDKAMAVRRLTALYQRAWGDVTTIGLGDGWNDVGFLGSVDLPIVVRSKLSDSIRQAVPRSMTTSAPGGAGWNDAVLQALGASPGLAMAAS